MLKERKFYPKFKATVIDGKMILADRRNFDRYIMTLEGKKLDVTVKPEVKERSRQEEKFYRAVVVKMVAEAMTVEEQEAHDFLRGLFLTTEESKEVETPKGKKTIRYTRVLNTTELSDKAYREYWEKCIDWAALPTKDDGLGVTSGLSLYVPLPNEVDYANY